MVKGILIGLFLTITGVLAQIVISQICSPRKMFNLSATIFLASIPLFLILYFVLPDSLYFLSGTLTETNKKVGLLNGLFVYLLLFFNYMQCLYYFTRPVTLRILKEFLCSQNQVLDIAQLKKLYNLSGMIQSRLNLLLLHGYLFKIGKQYELTKKGKNFASILLLLRTMFGIPYYLDRKER